MAGLITSLPNAITDIKSFEIRFVCVFTGLSGMDLETAAALSDVPDFSFLILLTEMTNFDCKVVGSFNVLLFSKLLEFVTQISSNTETNAICVSFLMAIILFVNFEEKIKLR